MIVAELIMKHRFITNHHRLTHLTEDWRMEIAD
jgi:hypothetical protein